MSIEFQEQVDRAHAGLAQSLAAFATGVPLEEVRTLARGRHEAAFARQVAMYLAHVGAGMSLARVALAFRRDRSTVAHACQKVEDRREDAAFDRWIDRMEQAMRAAPEPAPVLEHA
jgi:chromosomal replication initiation ATPase DnaA